MLNNTIIHKPNQTLDAIQVGDFITFWGEGSSTVYEVTENRHSLYLRVKIISLPSLRSHFSTLSRADLKNWDHQIWCYPSKIKEPEPKAITVVCIKESPIGRGAMYLQRYKVVPGSPFYDTLHAKSAYMFKENNGLYMTIKASVGPNEEFKEAIRADDLIGLLTPGREPTR